MSSTLSFRHSLSLIIRLTDTTTGKLIASTDAGFRDNGRSIRYVQKEPGVCGFMEVEGRSGEWEVRASGFLPRSIRLPDRSRSPSGPPGGGGEGRVDSVHILEAPLIPGGDHPELYGLYTCEGQMTGLRSVDAVALTPQYLRISSFETSSRHMTLFNPKNLSLCHHSYGLIDPESQSYEVFSLAERQGPESVETEGVLKKTIKPGQPIGRLIYGVVDEEGGYLIRLRKNGGRGSYLIRYQTETEELFRLVDLERSCDPGQKEGCV